jgi:hypothetical protein
MALVGFGHCFMRLPLGNRIQHDVVSGIGNPAGSDIFGLSANVCGQNHFRVGCAPSCPILHHFFLRCFSFLRVNLFPLGYGLEFGIEKKTMNFFANVSAISSSSFVGPFNGRAQEM